MMNKKQKKRLAVIITALVILAAAAFCEHFTEISSLYLTVPYFISYLIVGFGTLAKAIKNIFRGQVFDENFLMAIATVGAIALGEMMEANAVMIFYQIGELFESCAVDKSRRSISALMDIRPDYANVLRDGEEIKVDPYDVKAGEIIIVRPGEKIPMDGRIVEGLTSLDTAALTGEAEPRSAEAGDDVISGCINMTGVVRVEVTKEFEESTVSKILDLVENAASKKANVEKFITKFAAVYTPIVCLAAALTAILPPLVVPGEVFAVWIYRALTFLVISCPCALVISIPLSFFGGVGGASKLGILVKGSNYLEILARTETVVTDKTGTITTGTFDVEEIKAESVYTSEELLDFAAYSESYSHHPISLSIVNAYDKEIDSTRIKSVNEIAGRGVCAEIKLSDAGRMSEGKLDNAEYNTDTADRSQDKVITVHAGNAKLMNDIGINNVPVLEKTTVYIAVNRSFAGYITFADKIKSDAADTVKKLKLLGVKNVVMLTGDKKETANKVAAAVGIDEVRAELLPQDKVTETEKILAGKNPKKSVVFVGDGINDAPVLARADIGVAMGGLGSDAAIEAADVVIMTDEPSKLAAAIGIAKKTAAIARQNVIFALGVKFAVLVLAAFGYAHMWAAIFADVGVAVLAILNSIRALNVSKFQ